MRNIQKLDASQVSDIMSLTPMQKGMLYHYLKEPDNSIYMEQICLHIGSAVSLPAFYGAWEQVVRTNEMMRTIFRWERIKEPVQIVMNQISEFIEYLDYSGESDEDYQTIVERIINEDHVNKFSLDKSAFRVMLFKLAEEDYLLLISNHHILFDGWSTGIILSEFVCYYESLCKKHAITLKKKTRFKEYIKLIQKKDKEEQKKFWKNYLKDLDSCFLKDSQYVDITDGRPDSIKSYRTHVVKEIYDEIKKNGRFPVSCFIYGAWALLQYFYTDTEDVLFGTTVSGREESLQGIENMVGLFINTLPFRIKIDTEFTMKQILEYIFRSMNARKEFSTTPLVDIKEYSGIDGGRNLFDTILVVENYPVDRRLKDSNLHIQICAYRQKTNFDLSITAMFSDKIEFIADYNSNVYTQSFIEEMFHHYIHILKLLVNNSDKKVSEIDLMYEAEKEKILGYSRSMQVDLPESTIHMLFEQQAEKQMNKAALVFNGDKITYRQVKEKVDKVASLLIKNEIVSKNQMTGILMERSPWVIIAMLGILKAGGAYVPINPYSAKERVKAIIQDGEIKGIVTKKGKNELLNYLEEECKTLKKVVYVEDIDECQESLYTFPTVSPQDTAYVIYTSGSTGTPKGVMISHENVVNFITTISDILELKEEYSCLALTTYCFDIFVLESLLPLCIGMKVVMASEQVQRDPDEILKLIRSTRIDIVQATPTRMKMLTEAYYSECLADVKKIIVGGEVFPAELYHRLKQINGNDIYNAYGPTETTVWSAIHLMKDENVSIGRQIGNTGIYILSKNMQLRPTEVIGELCISGKGVAKGYLNQLQRTREKFLPNPFIENEMLYRTGDYACWMPDGTLKFLGRKDNQVKIRGHRIELGEVENTILGYKNVKDVVVLDVLEKNETCLVAYLIVEKEFTISGLRNFLNRKLDEYLIPTHFYQIEEFPMTQNLKVDRNALLAMNRQAIVSDKEMVMPRNKLETEIADIWKEVLNVEQVSVKDRFFEAGGNSIKAIQLYNQLIEHFDIEMTINTIFSYPTISDFAEYYKSKTEAPVCVQNKKKDKERESVTRIPDTDIAVIGMAGRFPGADDTGALWDLIKEGKETVSSFTKEEARKFGIDEEMWNNPNFISSKGRLKDADCFDYEFFTYTWSEAQCMDPQTRVLHECAWHALEDAGYEPDEYEGLIGLYVGSSDNVNLLSGKIKPWQYTSEQFQTYNLNNNSFGSLIAYKMNLRGPAITIQSACSTSLVAIDRAYKDLILKECDIAIAGGVSVSLFDEAGYMYQEGMVFSKDGHCRAFDKNASGTVSGNGVGLVVLKRLEDALADEDNIYAVLKATAVNNDGSRKVGYTAPSSEGQAEVIKKALKRSGISAEDINYLETHGTGTALGDPIEIEGLKNAFHTNKKNYCALGSVKNNIGHLGAAAGVAGFIKAVLILNKRVIPPMINFLEPNPIIDLKNSPFYVNTEAIELKKPQNALLHAGVSSFGMGGNNVHVILEEGLFIERSNDNNKEKILILSANNFESLARMKENLFDFLKRNKEINLSDVAYTLATGRRHFKHRFMCVCSDREEAVKILESGTKEIVYQKTLGNTPGVTFMFSGQGGQYVNMGRGIYEVQPLFREIMDKCFSVLDSLTGLNYKNFLFSDVCEVRQDDMFRQSVLQPLLFSIEISLAKLLKAWGMNPEFLIGYSIGEYVSACLAGVFSLEDALMLTYHRGRLMENLEEGVMLTVPITEKELEKILPKGVYIAVVNGESCIVSGKEENITLLERVLKSRKILSMRLSISHAGHSGMLEPMVEEFRNFLGKVTLNVPQQPFVSSLTGERILDEEATNIDYWVQELLQPVRFVDGFKKIAEEDNMVFIEIGPGRTLSTLIQRFIKKDKNQKSVATIPPKEKKAEDCAYLYKTVGKLWSYGVEIDWKQFYGSEKRKRISLPGYSFIKNHFKMEYSGRNEQAHPAVDNSEIYLGSNLTNEINRFIINEKEIELSPKGAIIAALVCEILGIDSFDEDEDFFEVGFDSLKSITLLSRINEIFHVNLTLRNIFDNPTIKQLLILIQEKTVAKGGNIHKAEEREYYPASSQQKRLYALQKYDQDGTSYNISGVYILKGQLNIDHVNEAFQKLINRHEVLRTQFEMIDQNVVQRVLKCVEFYAEYIEEYGMSTEQCVQGFVRPFQMNKAPLLRVKIVKTDSSVYVMLIDLHHIISDGLTIELIMRDFLALYDGTEMKNPEIQYKDYAVWQQLQMKSVKMEQARNFWLNEFKDNYEPLNLPTDYPEKQQTGFFGDLLRFELSDKLYGQITEFCNTHKITMFMFLLGCYNILLSNYCHQNNIVVGTPVAGREPSETGDVAGVFINTVAIQSILDGEKTFEEYIGNFKSHCLEVFQYQNYPFEELVYELDKGRDANRNFFVKTMFTLEQRDRSKLVISGFEIEKYEYHNGTCKFPLMLQAWVEDGKAGFNIEYSNELYKKSTIERMGGHYIHILEEVLCDRYKKISEIEIITASEKEQILNQFNDTAAGYDLNRSLTVLIEETVRKRFYEPAVLFEGESLTYGQLNEQANKVANFIKNSIGSENCIVGIMINRSFEMIIGLLGILKAGCAYLPINPDEPEERLRYIIKQSGMKLLLTHSEHEGRLSSHQISLLKLDKKELYEKYDGLDLPKKASCNDLAYIIYTSGSTGEPKGAMIEHRGLVNRLMWMKEQYNITQNDVVLQKTTYTFDVSVWELFLPLLGGGKLCFAKPGGEKDPEYLYHLINESGVTILHFVPSMLSAFLSYFTGELTFSTLKCCICSGEELSAELKNRFFNKIHNVALYNLYGPTEATIDVTCCEVKKQDVRVSIGRPVANTQILILSENLKMMPIGVAGELCIAGVQVGRGYLNNPDITGEKFIKNPFIKGEWLYKTGDLAKWLPNGMIEYIGRKDSQIKIRGFRIELGEIESRLEKFDGIQESVVAVKGKKGEDYLCAFYVSDEEISVMDLKEYLKYQIPEYMIPSQYVRITEVPLTANGKVNRKALPEPTRSLGLVEYEQPHNETEKKLQKIWSSVLNLDIIGIHDNFFVLGGDSILVIRLVAEINQEFSSGLQVKDVFLNKTIKELAALIKKNTVSSVQEHLKNGKNMIEKEKEKILSDSSLMELLPADYIDFFPLSSIQQGMVYYSKLRAEEPLYHDQFVYQIKFAQFNFNLFSQALELLSQKHDILRTSFMTEDFPLPVQVIHSEKKINLQLCDISRLSKQEQEVYINQYLSDDVKEKFSFNGGQLWRMKIFQLDIIRFCVVLSFQHAILDGWSVASMMAELNDVYNELLKGRTWEVQKLATGYKDYIAISFSRSIQSSTVAFWKNHLSGYKRTKLPFNLNGKLIRHELLNKKIVKELDHKLLIQLEKKAGQYGCTIKEICFASYLYLLRLTTQDEDIVTGLVTHDRPPLKDSEKVLGCYLNTIPVRIKVKSNMEQERLLSDVKTYLSTVKEHEIFLTDIVSFIGSHDNGRNPIFDTLFNYTDMHVMNGIIGAGIELDTDTVNVVGNEMTNTLFDLEISRTLNKLTMQVKYSPNYFYDEDINTAVTLYIRLLEAFVTDEETSLNAEDFITAEEKHQLIYEFNNTKREYPRNKMLHQLFEEQTDRTPFNTALKCENKEMTYKHLNEKANQFARYLIEHGVQVGENIAIITERNFDMIIGMLAILKCGAAYVPVDPEYPEERKQYILKSANVVRVVTDKPYRIKVCEELILTDEQMEGYADDNLDIKMESRNLAYIIYTSGSSGVPKGVMIEHHSIVNLITWVNKEFEINGNDSLLFLTSMCFDLSVYDIFGILAAGGKVVIARKDQVRESEQLKNLLQLERITFWDSVPSTLNYLVNALHEEKSGFIQTDLRLAFMSGDWIPVTLPDRIKKYFPNVTPISLGGATEATVWSIYYPIKEVNPYQVSIPYGRPIANNYFYILDKNGKIVPKGVAGELYIGGAGVARGYINDEEKTKAAFVSNRFIQSSERMYRTGDLGRMLSGGNIEFLGRIDNQVKIRGYRVELGEIEKQILSHQAVKDAIVLDINDTDGNKCIAAFIVIREKLSTTELKEYLREKLPEYMIPTYFTYLDRIPLTENGKIDRKLLRSHKIEIKETKDFAVPENDIEDKLVEIWKEILGVKRVSVEDKFFEIGGHSLRAATLASRIHKEFGKVVRLREIFSRQTIKELAEYIERKEEEEYLSIEPAEEKEYYSVSSAQKRLYMLYKIEEKSISYNLPSAMIVEGKIDRDAFQSAFSEVMKRHEILRTSFEMIDGEPVQRIHNALKLEIEYVKADEKETYKLIREFIRPFDLSTAPLFRIQLIQVAEERHIFVIDMHHIISDGISMAVFTKEIIQAYANEPLPEVKLQYKDFAAWQNRQFGKKEMKKQENYWLNQLKGEIPVLNLPTDYKRPEIQSYNGATVCCTIDKEIKNAVYNITEKNGVTLFMTLIAALNVLLYKYTGQNDIIIGTPVAGRRHTDLSNSIGVFVNTLVIRNHLNCQMGFKDFLAAVKKNSVDAFENQDVQFERLVELLEVKRDISRNPIFDVMFVLQNMDMQEYQVQQLTFQPYQLENTSSKFDLSLTVTEKNDSLELILEYCTSLFQNSTIEKMINHYIQIIKQISESPEKKLAEIDILLQDEKKRLLHEFNGNTVKYESKPVYRFFEEQVSRRPENPAVILEGRKLTYRELNEKANQLAWALLDRGVKSDEIVGIMMERSFEMIIGIIGIMKAGCAYLPIDPEYPEERIKYIVEDSGINILISKSSCMEKTEVFHFRVMNIEKSLCQNYDISNLDINVQLGHLAYVIYTSGSTGRPKGVMSEHGGLTNRLLWMAEKYEVDEHDVILQKTNYTFDVSVWELFLPLIKGAILCMAKPGGEKDPEYLYQLINDCGVSILHFVPSMLSVFLYAITGKIQFNRLKYCICSGEELTTELKDRFFNKIEGVNLYNLYGPTEASIDVSYYEVKQENQKIPIGKCIDNVQLLILDENNRLQPIGVPGELCIAGIQVARGYLNKPELTAERFIEHPYNPAERIYLTGDLAKWCADGNIEYLGRKDKQVKIRGIRVELGEIESTIQKYHNSIELAVVESRGASSENIVLCAFFTAKVKINIEDLKQYLNKQLPIYMIPEFYMQVEAIPHTASGKIDRKALAQMPVKMKKKKSVLPGNEHEKMILQVWRKILQADDFGIEDDFFELGGNSLNVIQLHKMLREECNLNFDIANLYRYRTISSFLNFIHEESERKDNTEKETDRREQLNEAKLRKSKRLSKLRL